MVSVGIRIIQIIDQRFQLRGGKSGMFVSIKAGGTCLPYQRRIFVGIRNIANRFLREIVVGAKVLSATVMYPYDYRSRNLPFLSKRSGSLV